MTKLTIAIALLGSIGLLTYASAQSADPYIGRHLVETVCTSYHQIDATSPNPSLSSGEPSFVDISRMPSTNELFIKVFLRTSHPPCPTSF
jgi:hypothetical protein